MNLDNITLADVIAVALEDELTVVGKVALGVFEWSLNTKARTADLFVSLGLDAFVDILELVPEGKDLVVSVREGGSATVSVSSSTIDAARVALERAEEVAAEVEVVSLLAEFDVWEAGGMRY